MPLSVASPRRHIKPYHQHHHLLIQFILSELILAHQETLFLTEMIESRTALSDQKTVEKLIFSITKLSGSSQGYMRLFSWSDDGILAKLKNYCTFFCLHSRSDNIDQMNIHKEANQTWLLSLEVLDLARIVSQRPDSKDANSLRIMVRKMVKSIQKLARLVAKVLPRFHHNENVIFFLLRHAEQLDRVYGIQFVVNMLKKMFPRRPQKIHQFLLKKYLERGFDKLVPTIEHKLALLDL